MRLKKAYITILLLSIFLSNIEAMADTSSMPIVHSKYYNDATILIKWYKNSGYRVKRKVIMSLLRNIDKYLPIYFPKGQFNREDFITLAIIESDCNQFEVGENGELGVFQIMRENCEDQKVTESQFDIGVNTQMAMIVLRGKYREYHSYRFALIAYNGLVRSKITGKIEMKYWNRFQRYRKIVCKLGL